MDMLPAMLNKDTVVEVWLLKPNQQKFVPV